MIFDWLFKRKYKKTLPETSAKMVEKTVHEETVVSSASDETVVEAFEPEYIDESATGLILKESLTGVPVNQCNENVYNVLLQAASNCSTDIFRILWTEKELRTIVQRIHIAKLLCMNNTFNQICKATGASTATISKVNRERMNCGQYSDTIFERIDLPSLDVSDEAYFLNVIGSLSDANECHMFFGILYSPKETETMQQRITIAGLLKKQISYSEITALTGASSATIARIKECMDENAAHKIVSDSPFCKPSEIMAIEKNETQQQVIPIQQTIMHDDEEDDLPFGMPVRKQEDVLEAMPNEENPTDSETIVKSDVDENGSIAPSFTVQDGVIVHTESGNIIEDAPIDVLGLTARTYNVLRCGEIYTLCELVSLQLSELRNIKNLVKKSEYEILKTLDRYLIRKISGKDLLTNDEKNGTSDVVEESAELVNLNPSVESMPLSVRARNCLRRNGISDLRSLLETKTETLRSFRNLGSKTLNEIIAYKEENKNYLDFMVKNEQENNTQLFAHRAEIEIKRTEAENREKLKNVLFRTFYSHALFSYDRDTLYRMAEEYRGIEMLDDILTELVDENKIEQNGERGYKLKCIHILEYARTELNASNHEIEILQKRMNGKTLEEIAESRGLTRERIRQCQNRLLHTINKKSRLQKIMLYEEMFRYLFEHYDISEEVFCEITKEPVQTYRYLALSGRCGSESLDDLLSDSEIPEFIKSRWEQFLRFSPQSPYIYLNESMNRRVCKERIEIEKYILSEHCSDELTFEEFAVLYNDFLHTYHLADEKNLQLTETELRSRENHFAKCDYLLWKQGKRLRYYPILSKDYTELFETLHLGQYRNTEISALKLFREHPDIMEQYDIRDEYELHNLLKKIGIEQENPSAVFKRTPYIQFGKFDRDAMIKKNLFEHAPLSSEKLAEVISEEYGFQAAQVQTWFECIKEYFRDGMFTVDYETLPDAHMELLKAELTENFYYIHEIKEIYCRLVPDADENLISSFNLTRMGFLVNSNYVIQNYSSAAKYFEHLLITDDIVDISPFSARYATIQQYYVVLQSLSNSMQIIEYEPYQYIHIRRLNKLGVTTAELREYCETVFDQVETDTFFTVEALQKSGFSSDIDRLGFKPWFYASILRTDKRFHYNKLGGTVLFYKGKVRPELRSFLVDMLSYMGSVELDELLELAKENYGISLDRDRVKYAISDTGLYYDTIMETVYQDYDTYYRTISGIDDEE